MTDLRRQISLAAHDLFLQEGIEGISMRKVARQVGVTAPALYRHFRDKNALLGELIEEALRQLQRELAAVLGDSAVSPEDRLRRMVGIYVDFALTHPHHFDLAFMQAQPNVRPLGEALLEPGREIFLQAIREVERSMVAGQLRPGDPLETAILIWSTAHGLITLHRRQRLGDDASFRALFRRSLDALLLALAPDDRSGQAGDGSNRVT